MKINFGHGTENKIAILNRRSGDHFDENKKKRVDEHHAVNLLIELYGLAQASKSRTGLRSTSPLISSPS
jgi:hypothetical protein